MFDHGLFTVRYEDDQLRIQTSPKLVRSMVAIPERGVDLAVRDGTAVLFPNHPSMRPNRDALQFHQRRVFIAD
jgi:hypothetical protein